ncbi:MAG: energy-coupling factor transporter ATPase [Clostridiales bacterium]|nr:energy-coupling factor transporter ATPase [Clostridiales bacterium]MDY4061273.1 energy-coupling factor transporter ATPase [Anaerovoracaceae bacterium]
MSIQVENIFHTYNKGNPDEKVALRDVSFNIEDGEILGVIGHTGSGKSTMLQHLNGLLKPDSGRIVISGTEITAQGIKLTEIRKRVGLVFQYPEYQLFEETVAKDIAFGPKNLGVKDEEIEKTVRESLEMVGLSYDELSERSPFELSGGQKRRVAIAGVIAMKPDVLILDEPTSGLDPFAHREVLNMIRKIHRESSGIIIFVSHNMRDIAAMSDKVLVMDRGSVLAFGKVDEIFKQRKMLRNVGLSTTPAAALFDKLEDRGVKIRSDAVHIDEVEEAIYNYMTGGENFD